MRRGFAWRKLGVILLCVLLAWGMNSIFTIRAVEVSGEGIAVSVDATKLPKNLLFFQTREVSEQILKDYPLVARVVIRKKYPSTLVITAVPRKSFAIVGVGSEIYSVDETGVVLAQYPSETDLPFVRIVTGPLQPGLRISDQKALTSIAFLRESISIIRITEVVPFDSTSLLALAEGMSIYFSQGSDSQALAHTLQTLVTGFRIKGTLPQTVDLRFDKPVVTF